MFILRRVQGHRQMEIYLDRRLTFFFPPFADTRGLPACDIQRSGTRKDELLLPRRN